MAQSLTQRLDEEGKMYEVENRTMLTDLYQLTMGAAYFDNNKNEKSTFDMFVRKLPNDWGYFIANGIEDAVDYVTNLKFEKEDTDYLRNLNMFKEDYLDFLENFKFNGEVYAVEEGTPVAPNTPLMIIKGDRIEAQFVETMILNSVNFQTLIASKAGRVVNSARPAAVIDYGLRRAHEKDAGMKGARASYIAGCVGTSNVQAGKEHNISIKGTHAHSFVMGFPTELDAFRAYVKTFPNNATLLIDTYDSINGARNAAIVAKELETKGKRLGAVRLDSGDLAELSKEIRKMFDNKELNYIKITASNDLDEYEIEKLKENGAQIDGYGVGTSMITARPDAALSGVYKLVEDNDGGKIKLSPGKKTYPGTKQVFRVSDENGNYQYDTLALDCESCDGEPLIKKFAENGQRTKPRKTLENIRKYSLECVSKLPESAKMLKAEPYRVKVSPELENLVDELSAKFQVGGKNE